MGERLKLREHIFLPEISWFTIEVIALSVIEKEKLERKVKKEAKECQNADKAARKEAAQQQTEQL